MATRRLRRVLQALGPALLHAVPCLALIFFSSCGKADLGLSTGAVPVAGPLHISAQWLRDQPGIDIGEFAFRLLNASGEPVPRWRDVTLVQPQPGLASFELRLQRGAPDDLYLYVAYPGDRFTFDSGQLDAARAGEYLLLAVPHRILDVVVLGASRIGQARQEPAAAGPLARISFTAGREQALREVSAVNEDIHSAPLLELSTAPGGGIQLDWDERNIGDYDNNSQVGIADVTPVGIRFGQQLAGSMEYDELLLIDGDENGVIGIGDLTPIGRNFARFTQGFSVYHATVDNPQDLDFSALAKPTLLRQDIWDAATPDERKRRLHYTFEPPAPAGPNSYYVRAYSNDGGTESEGPVSNTVSRQVNPANQAPYWTGTAGLISATGVADGITASFDGAADPELDALVFSVSYVLSPGVPGDPGTVSIDIPAAVTAGPPPYNYHIGPLAPGAEYQLTVQVRDAYHDPLIGTVLSARVPAGGDSDPWPQQRGDNARTGRSAASLLKAPLVTAWETPLGEATLDGTSVVASKDGWAGAFCQSGVFKRYDLATGALLATHPAPPEPAQIAAGAYPVLRGNQLLVGVSTGVALYDLSTLNPPVVYTGPGAVAAAPLLVDDVVYTADTKGTLRAFAIDTGSEVWSSVPITDATYHIAPCCDEQYLYVVADSGALAKLRLADGAVVQTGALPALPSGDALALDAQRGKLYLATEADRLVEISAATLAVERRLALETQEVTPTAACLILDSSPPLAVVGVPRTSMIEVKSKIVAVNLDTFTSQWEAWTGMIVRPLYMTASSDLIVAGCSGVDYLLDFQGRLRQTVSAGGYLQADPAILPGKVVRLASDALSCEVLKVPDNPPAWSDTIGIMRCTRTVDSMNVYWEPASDADGQPVYYAIYYSETPPPQFDAPYTGTVLVTDMSTESEVSGKGYYMHTITGIDPGKDYYAGVRAYDAPWDAAPQIEQNTNWLKATPQWQEESLVLNTDLPAGEVFFMRGMADPAGTLHLVYTDKLTGDLTHVYGTTGNWKYDGAGLAGLEPVVAFEPAWDADESRLGIAYAGTGSAGIIARTGADTWNVDDWSTALPVTNPQVSLAYGPGPALAYTRFISGEFPVITEHYYIRREIGGTLMDYELLDDQNYCGRDLDVVFAPSAGADQPWIAMQRGTEAVPGRLTPEIGTLVYAQANTGGGFDLTTIDAGVLAPDSDCGKRVQQVLDAAGDPHLAYLDLNASGVEDLGQLKYAARSGSTWQLETVDSFSLPFQQGQLQHTYGELGLGLTADGRVVLAMLFRSSVSDDVDAAHQAEVRVYVRALDGTWSRQRVTDDVAVFLRDREPCVFCITPDGVWHIFYATYAQPWEIRADKIVHLWSAGQ